MYINIINMANLTVIIFNVTVKMPIIMLTLGSLKGGSTWSPPPYDFRQPFSNDWQLERNFS